MRTRTTAIRRALVDSPADVKLMDEAVRFDRRVTAIQRALRGDETLRGTESGIADDHPESRQLRGAGLARPQRRADRHAADELHHRQRRSHRAGGVAEDARSRAQEIRAQLEAAGVPYTPGRWPGNELDVSCGSIPNSGSPVRSAAAAAIDFTSSFLKRRSSTIASATPRRGSAGPAPLRARAAIRSSRFPGSPDSIAFANAPTARADSCRPTTAAAFTKRWAPAESR